MKEIQAKTRSVRELLSDTKYGIDYYQREYKWQTKQIVELVSDLTTAFLEEYQPQHERKDVASTGITFLVPSLSASRTRKTDRRWSATTTSLSLLLIYLHNIQKDRPDAVSIEKMIFPRSMGRSPSTSTFPSAMSA